MVTAKKLMYISSETIAIRAHHPTVKQKTHPAVLVVEQAERLHARVHVEQEAPYIKMWQQVPGAQAASRHPPNQSLPSVS